MKKRDEVIDWHKYFTYKDGNIYWKEREESDGNVRFWNSRNAFKKAGHFGNTYVQITFNKTKYYAHRIIWEMFNGSIPDDMEIDHINFEKHDNRIKNLQLVNGAQNKKRNNQINRGYMYRKKCTIRPYRCNRTYKFFGTACGAYMSYATAFLQGESNGDSR